MDSFEDLKKKYVTEKEYAEMKKQGKIKSVYVIFMADGMQWVMAKYDDKGLEQPIACTHTGDGICPLCVEIAKHERMYHGRKDVIVVDGKITG